MKCFFISILYFTLFFFYSFPCKALDVYQFVDTRAQSMGNTFSVLPGFANPAGYGFNDSRHIAVQYLNRYGVTELSTYSGSLNFPNEYLNTGLFISRYGFSEYNQLQVSGNFYKVLTEYLVLGIRLNYLNLHYSTRESSKSILTGDVGILLKSVDKFLFSVLLVNPFQTNYQIGEEKLKSSGRLIVGASYQIEALFLVTGEIEKDFSNPFLGKLGVEYQPIKQLAIRAGVYARPFIPSFGIGIYLSELFGLDISFRKHPVLGIETGCGLQFNF